MIDTVEVAALKEEIAALHARLAREQELVETLMARNPDAVAICEKDGALTFNAVAKQILVTDGGSGPVDSWSTRYGLFLSDQKTPHPVGELPLARAMGGESVRDYVLFCRTPSAPDGIWLQVSASPLAGGAAIAIFRDVTERKQLEDDLARRHVELAERAEENQALVQRLRAALDELATPVLELWDDVLALPVVGVVDTQRSAQMAERLLAEVLNRRARFVIIDLTGVDVVDTSTADRFLKMARAVNLLGAECIVSGIQPGVARTLIELGVDFQGLRSERNLKRALDLCLAQHRTSAAARRDG